MSVKTSINLSDELYKEAKEMTENFSALVSEALTDYIQRKKVEKAMSSFGKWKGRKGRSDEIVKKLRKDRKL